MKVEIINRRTRNNRASTFFQILLQSRRNQIPNPRFRAHQHLHGPNAPLHRHIQQHLRQLRLRRRRRRSHRRSGIPLPCHQIGQRPRPADLLRRRRGSATPSIKRRGLVAHPAGVGVSVVRPGARHGPKRVERASASGGSGRSGSGGSREQGRKSFGSKRREWLLQLRS